MGMSGIGRISEIKGFGWQALATSRHMSPSVRLLPSGPDRVSKISLRENQSSP